MKKILSTLLLTGVLALAALTLGTGCASNKQQVVESLSGDGVLANAAVPVSASTSIGLKLFVGRFNNTTVINPTASNQLYSASVGAGVAGAGKQGVSGSAAGTNGVAAITDGSEDGSVIVLGNTSGTAGRSATNGVISVTGTH